MSLRVRLLLLIGLLLLFIPGPQATQAQDEVLPVPIYVFWGETCPYCHQELAFLEQLQEQYPNIIVREYEVYNSQRNRGMLLQMLAVRGLEPGGVPVTFIGDQYWIGFSESVAQQITATVVACSYTACPDPGEGIVPPLPAPAQDAGGLLPGPAGGPSGPSAADESLTLPLIGTINLAGQSLWFSTLLIAFVDGFNPCSLWVLSILMALVIHSGSRKKTLLVGLVFLITTTLVYGLFITGLFSVFSFVGFIGWIQVVVAALALGFALINIKDYFWYKEGVSLTIGDQHKPGIYKRFRSLMTEGKSTPALIGATVTMALGIALIELPCTSGFPLLWTNLLAAQSVTATTFAALLGLYMLVYLVDELIVFGTVVVTLKASRLEEKQGRILKLVGGMIMLALALTLLVDPTLMNNIGSSLLVFGLALGATLLILLLHRVILPAFGIRIGSEFKRKRRGRRTSSG